MQKSLLIFKITRANLKIIPTNCSFFHKRSKPILLRNGNANSSSHSSSSKEFHLHTSNMNLNYCDTAKDEAKNTTSRTSTLDSICQNIIFENDAVIAVNKPAGISVYGNRSLNQTTEINVYNESQNQSIHQCLPLLSEKLKCSDLNVGLSLKSYLQGIILLCKDKKTKNKLDQCLTLMSFEKNQFLSYLAVTVGVPTCAHNASMQMYIKREYLHDREMSLVTHEGSQTACKKGLMIKAYFTVKPLVINTELNVALVEISVIKDKWDTIEALMSHYLSPVLGDEIYSSRVYYLKGVSFAASPFIAKPGTHALPVALQKVINEIPPQPPGKQLLLHRHKVELSKFPNSKSFLVIKCKPHEYFLQVLQALRLYDANVL